MRSRPAFTVPPWAVALGVLVLMAQLGVSCRQEQPVACQELSHRKAPFHRHVWRVELLRPFHVGENARLTLSGGAQRLVVVLSEKGAACSVAEEDERQTRHTPWPLPLKVGTEVLLLHSRDSLRVFQDGQPVVAVSPGVSSPAAGRWEQTPPGDPVAEVRYQKVAPAPFADDFARSSENTLSPWEPQGGEWHVPQALSPLRSANPFILQARAAREPAWLVGGEWFRSDFSLGASLHLLRNREMGLGFRWRSADCHYLLKWVPADGPAGQLELWRRRGGEDSLLGKAACSVPSVGWTRIEVTCAGSLIQVALDGSEILALEDPAPLPCGRVALWLGAEAECCWDDIVLDWPRKLRLFPGCGWFAGGTLGSKGGDRLSVPGFWGRRLGVRVRLAESLTAGDMLSVIAHQADGNELRWEVQADDQRVAWRASVKDADVLADQVLTASLSPGDSLDMVCRGAEVWFGAAGNAKRVTLPPGSAEIVRLEVMSNNPARIAEITCRRDLDWTDASLADPVAAAEDGMQGWGNVAAEWVPEQVADVDRWHRADFWQDVEVSLSPSSQGRTWCLALRGEQQDRNALVTLRCAGQAGELVLQLPHGESHSLHAEGEVSLARQYGLLLVRADGRVVWSGDMPRGMDGLLRVGFSGSTGRYAPAVRGTGLWTDDFRSAPAAWQPVSGSWQVTSRWPCDPRWCFFSGNKRKGMALSWLKSRHGRRVTVEFFAAPLMQSHQQDYSAAADLNVVLASDGSGTDCGYGFLTGGFANRGSQILAGQDVLAENPAIRLVIDKAAHHRWYYVKIRRDGERLMYWVDGQLVGDVCGVEAAGDRLGLWTYRNGFAIARVRVSSDFLEPSSVPCAHSPRCLYDLQE